MEVNSLRSWKIKGQYRTTCITIPLLLAPLNTPSLGKARGGAL